MTDRTLTRKDARYLRKRAWQTRRDSALFLPSLRDFAAIKAERESCARVVRDYLAPITAPDDAPERLRNERWAALATRLRNNATDLAHRRKVCRELALLASDPRWETTCRFVRAMMTIAVQWSGQTARQAWDAEEARSALKAAA